MAKRWWWGIGLRKRYGNLAAVDGISFQVAGRGEMVWLAC